MRSNFLPSAPAQTQGAPAQTDDVVGILGVPDAGDEAAQGLRGGIIAVAEPYFAGDGGAPVERFGAMLVRQIEMAETARAQIVDRVHAPIRAFAAGFADATAIRNPENAARPSKARTRRLGPQHRRHDLREKLARLMQPIVERGVGQIRDPSQLRPSRRLPQRQAAGTARQGQSQQRWRVRHAPPPPKRPRRERESVEVQIAQNMADQARPVFDESRC